MEFYLYEKFSQTYANEMFSSLDKIFIREKARNLNDIKEIISSKRINERSCKTAYRVFLNYIEEKELLDDDLIAKLRRKIKLNLSSKIDTYVPIKEEIEKSLSLLTSPFSGLYSLILQSGCRPSELREFIVSFSDKNIEYFDDIVVYRNFYLRNNKNSFYLFFKRETFDEFLRIKDSINLSVFNTFREKVVRSGGIVNLKYLRKYQFTLMIRAGIDFEEANFIQGRCSKNVGFNHYLAKKEIAVREYGKINFK